MSCWRKRVCGTGSIRLPSLPAVMRLSATTMRMGFFSAVSFRRASAAEK